MVTNTINQFIDPSKRITYVALTWIRLTQKASIDLYSGPCYHRVRFRLQNRISYYLCYAVYAIHSGEILRLFKVKSQISLICNFSPFWSMLVPVSEFLKLFHVVIFSFKLWYMGIRFQKWINYYVLARYLVPPPWTWVWWLGFDFYLTYETYRVKFLKLFDMYLTCYNLIRNSEEILMTSDISYFWITQPVRLNKVQTQLSWKHVTYRLWVSKN